MESALTVCMLGELSLSLGNIKAAERSNRSKEWILIAYLINNRHRAIGREELYALLLENADVVDPGNTFRKILWRARKALEPLSKALDTDLIEYRKGLCQWNRQVPIEVDAEQFEALCRQAVESDDPALRLDCYRRGLGLFQGEFLPKLFGEVWREPLAAYYLNVYVDSVLEAVPLLLEDDSPGEGLALCQSAIRYATYDEALYQLKMRCEIAQKDYAAAAQTYRSFQDLLRTELDVSPSEESQALYHEVLRQLGQRHKSLDMIQDQLREPDRPDGARLCDFQMFQMFYQMEARSAERRGDAIHIGVLTLEPKKGRELSGRSLERAMKQLGEQIQHTLRIGDVAASCSASQYVLLLVQANYENSQMVCQRVVRAFTSKYPTSPAKIIVDVMPLEPLSSVT